MKTFEQARVVFRLSEALKARGSWAEETHIQKAMYFLQELLGVPTGFEFILYKHGPFSFDLRATLTFMEAEDLIAWQPRNPYGPSLAAATSRPKRPLRGKHNIGIRAGKVLNRYKMGKHLEWRIEEDSFPYERKKVNIERAQSLDGIYVIRSSVKTEALSSQQVVESYKSLADVERAFRSLKTVDLHVRPIHHRLPDRVRAHILLCLLAYYVEWHMRQRLAPLLFDDHATPNGQAARASIVAAAQRSPAATSKALSKMTEDGLKVHSFQTLLGDLSTIVKNRIAPKDQTTPAFDIITTPTAIQQKALDLLGVPWPIK